VFHTSGRVAVHQEQGHSNPRSSSVHRLLSPTTSSRHIRCSHRLTDQYRHCSWYRMAGNCTTYTDDDYDDDDVQW